MDKGKAEPRLPRTKLNTDTNTYMTSSKLSPGGNVPGRRSGAPGQCRPGFLKGLRIVPAVLRMRPRHLRRFFEWTSDLTRIDPTEPHWHLGPVAVAAAWRGKGVGSALMTAFIGKVDQRGDYAYLETDKLENVAFYRRFGFDLMSESDLLGAHIWFMDRRPR